MEKTLRGEQNKVWIQQNSTASWAERVLTDMKRFKMNQTQKLKIGYGFGLEFKMMGLQSDFSKLDHTAVADAYRSSFNRVILLDVGGTITEAANLDPLSMYQRAKRRRNASKDDSTKKRTGEEVNNMLNAAGTMGQDVRTSTARRPTEQVLNAIKCIASDTTRTPYFYLVAKRRKY